MVYVAVEAHVPLVAETVYTVTAGKLVVGTV
jgi:hypothetical protein